MSEASEMRPPIIAAESAPAQKPIARFFAVIPPIATTGNLRPLFGPPASLRSLQPRLVFLLCASRILGDSYVIDRKVDRFEGLFKVMGRKSDYRFLTQYSSDQRGRQIVLPRWTPSPLGREQYPRGRL